MDEERRREVARMGGRAKAPTVVTPKWAEFSPEEAREAGRKGGRAVSQNREHMSAIGREGGESRAANHTRRLSPEELEEQSSEGTRPAHLPRTSDGHDSEESERS